MRQLYSLAERMLWYTSRHFGARCIMHTPGLCFTSGMANGHLSISTLHSKACSMCKTASSGWQAPRTEASGPQQCILLSHQSDDHCSSLCSCRCIICTRPAASTTSCGPTSGAPVQEASSRCIDMPSTCCQHYCAAAHSGSCGARAANIGALGVHSQPARSCALASLCSKPSRAA